MFKQQDQEKRTCSGSLALVSEKITCAVYVIFYLTPLSICVSFDYGGYFVLSLSLSKPS